MSLQLNITFLGTGTISLTPERSCTSIFIETPKERILVDIGCGTLRAIAKIGINIHAIDYIFLTHFHPDHISDLIPFIFALKNSRRRQSPDKLQVWGPRGFIQFMHGMELSYGRWIHEPSDSIKFFELKRHLQDFPGVRVIWNKVVHKFESVGYRFEIGGNTIAFSGDSGYCQELIRICQGADMAILECSHADEHAVEGHLSPSLAAKIAEDSKAKKLYLTHFYPDALESDIIGVAKKYYSGEIVLAEDGMKVSFPIHEKIIKA
jgi:ribonuclease BN (tRNA processing enzyme)